MGGVRRFGLHAALSPSDAKVDAEAANASLAGVWYGVEIVISYHLSIRP